jgi:hypothetical protein
MNQIAIGDPINGFVVLEGESVVTPHFKATLDLTYTSDPFLREKIAIQFKGTPAQIAAALSVLEVMIQRADLYDHVSYASPQYLRFQLTSGSDYYYTPISQMHLSSNPAGYKSQQTGSLVAYLYYTRPNYFDGPNTQVSLTGRAGTYYPGWYPLVNHTDSGAGDGSTVLISNASFSTQLPAPVRLYLHFSSSGSARLTNLYTGIFNHPTYSSDLPFFAYYNSLSGGTQHASATAIEGYYRSITWTSAAWFDFSKYLIDSPFITYFDGRSFRPILHLYTTHAYTDLYFKVQVERYGDVLYVSEPVYSPAGSGFVMFPPIELPPNYLLREVAPSRVQVAIYARRLSGAASTIEFDCLTIFPLIYAASFYGFINLSYGHYLVDDSHRNRHNAHLAVNNQETVAHTRVGGPLLLFPNTHNRIFFYIENQNALMPIAYTADLKAYYRPRIRLL